MKGTKARSESSTYTSLINSLDGVLGDFLMHEAVAGPVWGSILIKVTDPLAEDRFDRLEDRVYESVYTDLEGR